MKKTFFITHEDFRPDGDMPGQLRCYKTLAECLPDALYSLAIMILEHRGLVEDPKEDPLPDGLKEMYKISIWA